jgi:outer membrane receptor protein involved in Fe transport
VTYGLDGAYVGQTYNDDLNAQPLGAALLFDAQATARLRAGATLSLGVVNATRQTYLSSIDRYGPPLGVALRIGIPLGAPDPPGHACGSLP